MTKSEYPTTILTRIHLISEDDDEFEPIIEDLDHSIRINIEAHDAEIAMTLGKEQALKLASLIETYFMDKDLKSSDAEKHEI